MNYVTLIFYIYRDVTFLPDCVGPEVEEACKNPKAGMILLT